MTTTDVMIRRGDAGDLTAIVDLNTAMAVEMKSTVVSSTRLRDGVTAVLGSGNLGFYVLANSGGTVLAALQTLPRSARVRRCASHCSTEPSKIEPFGCASSTAIASICGEM